MGAAARKVLSRAAGRGARARAEQDHAVGIAARLDTEGDRSGWSPLRVDIEYRSRELQAFQPCSSELSYRRSSIDASGSRDSIGTKSVKCEHHVVRTSRRRRKSSQLRNAVELAAPCFGFVDAS